MGINRGPWNALVDDDGSNLVGSVWNKAAIQTVLLDPIDAALGTWVNVPFNIGNFANQPGITGAQILANSYTVIGKTLIWMMQQQGAPGSGTSQLILIPPVLPIGNVVSPLASASDGGAYTPGFVGFSSSTAIYIQKSTAANWTGPVYAYFTAIIQLP